MRRILRRPVGALIESLSKAGVMTLFIIIALFIIIYLRYGIIQIYAILIEIAIALIVTLSLNLEVGVTGISQFGRVICVIAGAYMVGGICGRIVALILGVPSGTEYADFMLNYRLVTEINEALSRNPILSIGVFLMYLVMAAAFGAFLGWLTSRPAIRLRGPFLGISLLAFGDALMYLGTNWWPLVGGTQAIHIPDPFRFLERWRFNVLTIISIAIALLILLLLELVDKSPLGRTFRAVRDSIVTADVYGKDWVKLRTISLMMGGAIAAVGGAIYVVYTGTCSAFAFTRLTWTFWPWAYMMLGGSGSHIGMLFGVILWLQIRVFILVERHALAGVVPFDPIWLEYILGGAMLMVIPILRPYGLVPERAKPILSGGRISRIRERIRGRGGNG